MIQLITDSTSDLPKELIDKYNITVIPLTITIDGIDYMEGIDLSPNEFIDKMLNAKDLPKTSMPSPGIFEENFKRLSKDGDVLCLTISSGLSGTYQSACLAADNIGTNVRVIDTLAGSLAHGLQLIEAGEQIKEGKSLDEIVQHLETMKKHSKIYILLDTLENIVKGGRLSKFQGSMAKVLNIKVILHGVEGKVEVLEKVHGTRKFLNRTVELIGEEKKDFTDITFGITHINNLRDAEYLKMEIIRKYNPKGVIINTMGATMGTYAGNKGMIVSYY